MKKRYLISFLFLLLITPQILLSQASKDTTTIIEKKYTIPIIERLQIRSIKKVPSYKMLQFHPEINPIFYDKKVFYQKLSIKKRKSLLEMFGYPILSSTLYGGTHAWYGGNVGFQINGGNFIPSFYWQMNNWENGNTTQHNELEFTGGLQFTPTPDIQLSLRAQYQDIHNKFNSGEILSANVSPQSPYYANKDPQDLRINILKTSFTVEIDKDHYFGTVSTSYSDLKQNWSHTYDFSAPSDVRKNQTQTLDLNYNFLSSWDSFFFWAQGIISSIQAQETNLDSTYADGALYDNKLGIGFQNNKWEMKLGAGWKESDGIFPSQPKRQFYPHLELGYSFVPGIISSRVYLTSGYEEPPLQYDDMYLNQAIIFYRGKNVLKQSWGAFIEWQVIDSLILSGGLQYKKYDQFHIFEILPDTFYLSLSKYDIFNGTPKITTFSLQSRWSISNFHGDITLYWLHWGKIDSVDHLPILPEKRIQLNVWYKWKRATAHINADFQGDRYQFSIPDLVLESFLNVNSEVFITLNSSIQLGLFGQNLLNSTIQVLPEQFWYERSVGLKVKVKF